MPNSAEFYKGIFLHVIPIRIIVSRSDILVDNQNKVSSLINSLREKKDHFLVILFPFLDPQLKLGVFYSLS